LIRRHIRKSIPTNNLTKHPGNYEKFYRIFLTFGQAVKAQSALDGFDPNANGDGSRRHRPAGRKNPVGGDFTTVSPNGGAAVARNRIARLNPDGSLDAGFNHELSDLNFTAHE
jgi:hypothetical protein